MPTFVEGASIGTFGQIQPSGQPVIGGGGGGTVFTVTLAESLALPPAPVQVMVYVLLVVMLVMICDPLVAFVPLHAPLAVHKVALALFHVSVEEPPEVIDVGLAEMVTMGRRGGGGGGGGGGNPIPPPSVGVAEAVLDVGADSGFLEVVA